MFPFILFFLGVLEFSHSKKVAESWVWWAELLSLSKVLNTYLKSSKKSIYKYMSKEVTKFNERHAHERKNNEKKIPT